MILTAFRLVRDHHTESQSFGYERPFWSNQMRGCNHFSPSLGYPIQLETTLKTNIFKLVEFYQRPEGAIIVERLAWAFDSLLYPYRAKYIPVNKEGYSYEPILFLSNLGSIHKRLSGIDVTFASPLQFYLNTAPFDDPWHDSTRRHDIADLYRQHQTSIDGIATQETDSAQIRHMFEIFDGNENPYHMHIAFEEWFVPKLPISEPLSQQHWNRPITKSALASIGQSPSPFDVSPVYALSPSHPKVTQYSPSTAHPIAQACEDITKFYTDVKVEYILSHRQIANWVVHHLVSRYVEKPNEALIQNYCLDIALRTIWLMESIHQKNFPSSLLVSITLSYGDEALIEVYTIDKKLCFYGLHLDLALIALTSSGIVAQTSTL